MTKTTDGIESVPAVQALTVACTRRNIDYDSIVAELMVAREQAMVQARQWFPNGNVTWLREFATIGFTSVRQSGKSAWGLKRLQEDDETVLVVANKDIKNMMITNWHHRQSTPVSELHQSRIFTMYELRQIMHPNSEVPIPSFKTIVFDDANYQFDMTRRNKFYKWLSSLKIVDPLIIMIG